MENLDKVKKKIKANFTHETLLELSIKLINTNLILGKLKGKGLRQSVFCFFSFIHSQKTNY